MQNLNTGWTQGKIKSWFSVVLLTALILTSCKKFLDIDTPSNQVVSGTVFEDDQTATSAVTGLYSEMMTSSSYFMFGGITVYPGMSADEMTYTGTNTSITPFMTNMIPADNSVITTSLWQYGYAHIYQANSVLEGLDKSAGVSPALKKQLSGEMYFIRALCYFYMVNLYGEVPLAVTTDYRINEILPRASAESIYRQIVNDLKMSRALLSNTFPTGTLGRPNRWAPAALLSRVYLYQKDWVNAEAMADSVITKSTFLLEDNLNNIFLGTSKEAIWQLATVNTSNSAEGLIFIPASATAKPNYSLTAGLLGAFEAGDKRKASWIATRVATGATYFYPFKYKYRTSPTRSEANTVLRLSEQYLIRAEARAMQRKFSDAIADINLIRQKHGGLTAPLPPPVDEPAATEVILKERRVELFAEWGHRWFDLKRTGKVDAVIGALKPSWKAAAALYPIPLTQLQRNPRLTPNPGY